MRDKNIAPLPEDTEEAFPIRPLTAEQARHLREQNPPLSAWWVVAGQAGVGVVAALLAWAVTGKQSVGWSVGYGALAVVIPAAVFARGLVARSRHPGGVAMGFLAWELLKVALTVAMLLAAPRVVPGLHWLGLLGGVIVATKIYWVALALLRRPRRNGN